MLDKNKLEDLASEVKRHGAYKIAQLSGVNQARVARFINNQQVVTMRELGLIQRCVERLNAPQE